MIPDITTNLDQNTGELGESTLGKMALSLTDISSTAVEHGYFGEDLVRPAYDSFSFAHLPGFIEKLLCGETQRGNLPDIVENRLGKEVKNVVFIFFDAFGWESFERFADQSEFLRAFQSEGHVLKTTSQFPSTTAAHITTLATGIPVYESGICEWYYYEPTVDEIINPFQFRRIQDKDMQTLLEAGMTPGEILSPRSFTDEIIQKGVRAFNYTPKKIAPSPYSMHFFGNTEIFGYPAVVNGAMAMKKAIGQTDQPEFHFMYIDNYDEACHKHSIRSNRADKEAIDCLRALSILLPALKDPQTVCILTADHGQVSLKATSGIQINKIASEIIPLLRQTKSGMTLRFGGSSRDLFLYTREGAANEVARILQKKLDGAATVFTQQEAAEAGLLGPTPLATRFTKRMADVLILPHKGYRVEWNEPGYYIPPKLLGMHGGASREEMETPLLIM